MDAALYLVLSADLSHSHVSTYKRNHAIFPENAAGNAIGILGTQLILGEVRVDNGGFSTAQTSIDYVVQHGSRKLVDHLCSQIVDDEQVTVEVLGSAKPCFPACRIAIPLHLEVR